MKLSDTTHFNFVTSVFLDCLGYSSGYSSAMEIINQYKKDKIDDDNCDVIANYLSILNFLLEIDIKDNKDLIKQSTKFLMDKAIPPFIIKEELKLLKHIVLK